ncbi:hypothetical protein Syun_022515 [Stephania yunnanensis]|uniref:Uncharacterized protein n=1 Tax=Stephania yunnanensis TaxID=152371 RepID=A0AAP0F7V6_9MAGN
MATLSLTIVIYYDGQDEGLSWIGFPTPWSMFTSTCSRSKRVGPTWVELGLRFLGTSTVVLVSNNLTQAQLVLTVT